MLARDACVRWLAILGLVACGSSSPELPAVTSHVIVRDVPQQGQAQLDVLVVIDDSPAMAGFHANVVANAPTLIGVLEALPGGLPDTRIAVTTADVADDGAFRTTNGMTEPYLGASEQVDGTRDVNFSTGTLADAFGKLVEVGSSGGTAKPLAMAKRALEIHPKFLRADAVLAVIVISATDDATDITASVKALKTDVANIIVSAVAVPDGGCTFDGATASATPGIRAFLDQFPNRGTFVTLCQADYSEVLLLIAQLEKTTLGVACLTAMTVECTAVDRLDGVDQALLPVCGSAPCYTLAASTGACTGDDPLELKVSRNVYPPKGDILHLECVVEDE